MPRSALSLIHSQSAPPRRKMSHPNAFALLGGRGRQVVLRQGGRMVRRVVLPRLDRAEAILWWQKLICARCRSVRSCAETFGCTEQTARNWMAGFSCPTGDAVMLAALIWPDAMAALAQRYRAA